MHIDDSCSQIFIKANVAADFLASMQWTEDRMFHLSSKLPLALCVILRMDKINILDIRFVRK